MSRDRGTDASVVEYYAGKSVFVTGGSGFLGRVFLEKLLYHCADVARVYVLLRDQGKVTFDERIKEITRQPVFERLLKHRPEILQKIIPVSGDITLPGLGINPQVAHILHNEVSVVFHTAALVKFKDKLETLFDMNTEGSRRVLEFCRKMRYLEVYLHVSSAYSQSQNKIIYEQLYPSPGDAEDIKSYIHLYDDNPDEYKYILQGRPNAYTLTKALAESIVAEAGQENHLPIIILRPSIISPVYKDPVPGWVDNFFGATGFAASICKGFNHVVYSHPDNIMDLIPVDFVANAMIAAAAKYKRTDEDVPVYNVCSGYSNPLRMGDLINGLIKHGRKRKLNVLPCFTIATESKLLISMITLFTELLPAVMIDGWLWITNREPWYKKGLKMLSLQREVTHPFT